MSKSEGITFGDVLGYTVGIAVGGAAFVAASTVTIPALGATLLGAVGAKVGHRLTRDLAERAVMATAESIKDGVKRRVDG